MDVRLAVIGLWAEDVPAAARFYREVVGLRLLPGPQALPHFDLGGPRLVIRQGRPLPPENPQPPRFPRLAFAVDDWQGALARLRAHGVGLPWGVEENASARWAAFHDPADNLIEFVQFKQAATGRPQDTPEE
jgi:catechol 2,3-dioxygenase-like lactoylglutathione lyase family enzyme